MSQTRGTLLVSNLTGYVVCALIPVQCIHGWCGPLVNVLIVLCEAVCCGAGGVGVSRVTRVHVCMCAVIDYMQAAQFEDQRQTAEVEYMVRVCV